MDHQDILVHHVSPPDAKIRLFRSLFRGRDDVYPRRFDNRRTGKSGYSPACANEWITGLCEKPRIKCGDCTHQRFLPIADDVVRWHLAGQDQAGREFVMGVYPLLRDESCFFLAADFDKADWQEDAQAVLETCGRLNLPAALERSRSGNGGHIWLFFAHAIPAVLARKLGAHILTETMEHRPDLGLDSYDRFFPNQDTLPQGGFGNLIALPLQKKPRELGNSVFLDDRGLPYSDQWAFLSSIRKIDQTTAERVVADAENRGRVIGVRLVLTDEDDSAPWTLPPARRYQEPPLAGPLPERLELILGNQIYIAKDPLPPGLRNRLVRLAAFQNPEFYKAQAMRLSTYSKPRVVSCAEDRAKHIGVPRGCLDDLQRLLAGLRIDAVIRDERNAGKPLIAEFCGELHPEQNTAAKAMLAHDTGVLSATTAFGKTVVAAWIIAQRRVNTLVLVHRRQLLEQWVQRLSEFLGLPSKTIGRIGGGRRRPTGLLDVALIQSLVREGVVNDCVEQYGQLIVDECHHLSAHSFEQVHRVNAKAQAAGRPFEHSVYVRPTGFQASGPLPDVSRLQFQEIYSQLVGDEARNRLICDEVQQAVSAGRSPLVLTERNEHLDGLAQRLSPNVQHLVVLRGGMSRKEVRAVMARLTDIPENEDRVLIATGRYIGEGFDDARLDTLFLTLPVSWHGTIAQYVGRLHRLYHRKREVRVYDFADLDVPMLARMFNRRCRGYEAVGYRILLPGSAVPGWPAEVPLPVDPLWKSEYAQPALTDWCATVSMRPWQNCSSMWRVPCSPMPTVSAGRAAQPKQFLYRRLETLPATKGQFGLNVDLPIPFDGNGRMEVDLLCADARLVVELDGSQHLEDADAYRRDRRKDLLLQENGYFVLRFLAEDVGKRLDVVLDAILRGLAHRRRN